MFIRFITEFKNEENEIETGMFQAAGFLCRSEVIYDYDKKLLTDLRNWFGDNLEKPTRFTKSKSKNAANVSLSWFKSTAIEHLSRMYEMKQLLEKYDLIVNVVKRDNPGYIVYEDDYQVSTLPHGKDKHLVK